SSDLSENVDSTLAAARLEKTAGKLLVLFKNRQVDPGAGAEQVEQQNEEARELLGEAERLANLETEQKLGSRLRDGPEAYFEGGRKQTPPPAPPAAKAEADERLARLLEFSVLEPCRELQRYNLDQIRKSDQENRAIVRQLRWGLLAVGLGLPLGGLVLGYAV